MTKIAHILGDWSRNIGNAFFQLGGQWAIQKTLPEAKIMLISEQPGYPSYWNFKGGNPANALDISKFLEVDYLVLMGPLFRKETEEIWGNALERIIAKGTKLVMLGVGAMDYGDENMKRYRNLLKRVKPHILISRDRETFEMLGDLASHAYDGIDFGFFMPEIYTPIGFGRMEDKYIAINFDKGPEPTFQVKDTGFQGIIEKNLQSFEFDSQRWEYEYSGFRTWLARFSRPTLFLEGLLFNGNKVDKIGDYTVIRTDHRPHPMLSRKTFRYPNMMVNDTPYMYAEIYGAASLTLTTRVHACVVSLSYGRSAMLFSNTPRLRLLDRLDLQYFTKMPVKLEKKKIDAEKKGIINFLKQYLK